MKFIILKGESRKVVIAVWELKVAKYPKAVLSLQCAIFVNFYK